MCLLYYSFSHFSPPLRIIFLSYLQTFQKILAAFKTYFLEYVWFHLFLNNSVHSCARPVRCLNVWHEGYRAPVAVLSNPALLPCRGFLMHTPQQHPQLLLPEILWGKVSVTPCLCGPKSLEAPKCSVLSHQEVETHELMFLCSLLPWPFLKCTGKSQLCQKHKSRKRH